MNILLSNLITDFRDMLVELANVQTRFFSGGGFVLYDDSSVLSRYHCSLVNDGQLVPPLKIGTSELIAYLVEITNYESIYHDGFHFINSDGILTHIAQFFSPPIFKFNKNILGQGARTLCSQCGSNIAGVLMVGAVSTNRSIYLFEKGNLVNERLMTSTMT